MSTNWITYFPEGYATRKQKPHNHIAKERRRVGICRPAVTACGRYFDHSTDLMVSGAGARLYDDCKACAKIAAKPKPTQAEKRRELRRWYRGELRRRRRMLREGTAPIDWNCGFEILWTEITTKADELGITANAVDLRLWWNGEIELEEAGS